MSADAMNALTKLLEFCVTTFGVGWTIAILICFPVLLGAFNLWRDKKNDRLWQQLVDEKEKSLQRLADESRELRVQVFKLMGWSDKDIEKYVVRGGFKNAKESRETLEGEK